MNMEYSNVVLFGVFTDAKNYTMDGLATINSSQLIEKSQLRTTKPNDAYLSGKFRPNYIPFQISVISGT